MFTMMSDIVSAGSSLLSRRAVEEDPGKIVANLPAWSGLVFLADAVVFLPILLFVRHLLPSSSQPSISPYALSSSVMTRADHDGVRALHRSATPSAPCTPS